MPNHPRIRVLCVDDHRIVREGIGLIIAGQRDMEVVGSAATGEEAVSLYKVERPDVTLMDLQLPTMSGLEAIQAIRREDEDARIIVLTLYQGDDDIHRALSAGATTYLLKDELCDDLIRFVREVHTGRQPIRTDVGSSTSARLGLRRERVSSERRRQIPRIG
jgi:DNA-binding NarL/FixJ family response regulator